MEMALAPGFLGELGKLPVIETGTEAAGDRLRKFSPLVMAKSVIGKSQRLGQQPAFAVVLVQESLDALLPVAATGADLLL